MKLSPRFENFRFRKRGWEPGRYVDVEHVTNFWVRGTDQDGKAVEFPRDELEIDWEKLGSTRLYKEGKIK